MRIIIYSKGTVFKRYQEQLDWDAIVAIADKNAEAGETIGDKPVILPQDICKQEYDYLVIFSDKYYYEIRKELIRECYVAPEKIMSIRFLIHENRENEIAPSVMKMLEEFRGQSLLDTEMKVIPFYFYTKQEWEKGSHCRIDGVGEAKYPYYNQIYTNLYDELEQVRGTYDMVYMDDAWSFDVSKLEAASDLKWERLLLRARYEMYTHEKKEQLQGKLQNYGEVKAIYLREFIYFIVSNKERNSEQLDAAIYVVTHKPYNVLEDDLYYPICVGKYQNEKFLSEHDGENIAYLNEKINECTAMYWIWKHTDSAYVGLNHYRRYFYENEVECDANYLDKFSIQHIFESYDMILPKLKRFPYATLREQLKNSIDEEAFEKGYEAVWSSLKKNQPEYLDAFDAVMQGKKMFVCNMFVMKREDFNQYCEWLFSFLIEAAETVDLSMYDNYSKRTVGFFAERMLTVWLTNQAFRIKELPIDAWETL